MDKFCRECGARLEGNMKFCANCGAAIDANRSEESDSDNPYSRQQLINKGPEYVTAYTKEEADYTCADSFEAAACEPESQLKHIPALYNFLEKFSIGRWLNHTVYVTDGRINRWAYFKNCILVSLLYIVVLMLGLLVCGACTLVLNESLSTALVAIVIIAITVFFLPASYMLGIRRLHDLNRAGWLVLLSLLPYVNIPLAIYLLFFKGTHGVNRYGEDPLANL